MMPRGLLLRGGGVGDRLLFVDEVLEIEAGLHQIVAAVACKLVFYGVCSVETDFFKFADNAREIDVAFGDGLLGAKIRGIGGITAIFGMKLFYEGAELTDGVDGVGFAIHHQVGHVAVDAEVVGAYVADGATEGDRCLLACLEVDHAAAVFGIGGQGLHGFDEIFILLRGGVFGYKTEMGVHCGDVGRGGKVDHSRKFHQFGLATLCGYKADGGGSVYEVPFAVSGHTHLGNHYIRLLLIINHLDIPISLCPTFPPYLAFITFHQIAYHKRRIYR